MSEVQSFYEKEEVENTIKDQYLTFKIESESYGVEVAYVKEIIRMRPITRVPETPDFIEGLINLRGDLTGVISVRKRFGKMPKEYDDDTCIVVITYNEFALGLIVDAVEASTEIPVDQIAPPPSAKLNYANQFIRNIGRVGNEVKLLLDLEKFLMQDYF